MNYEWQARHLGKLAKVWLGICPKEPYTHQIHYYAALAAHYARKVLSNSKRS